MAEHQPNSSAPKKVAQSNGTQPASEIETIYTTVEAQPDRTDWLTVVSNLRQMNRQLVEQIARLEQALASSKQTLHTYREEKQTLEITILQQQDELRLVHDRVGALFQQLETSHQIGQRQQILIENLSQQLEISQAIVPQLEVENQDLRQKYQQQTQKLTQIEEVASALNQRMQHQTSTPDGKVANMPTATEIDRSSSTTAPSQTTELDVFLETDESSKIAIDGDEIESTLDLPNPVPSVDPAKTTTTTIASKKPLEDIPIWQPTPPKVRNQKNVDVDRVKGQSIAANTHQPNYHPHPDNISSPILTPPPTEVINKESNALDRDLTITKSAVNWPAPTLDLNLPIKKTAIDLPKFPKK